MAKSTEESKNKRRTRSPATTPEIIINRCINAAFDLVYERLTNGSATSQETTYFLKLASPKENLEQDILEKQRDLITAKTEAIQSGKKIEELYSEAMKAFTKYRGGDSTDEEEDYDYDD